MSRYHGGGWAPYVPVVERRRKALHELEKLRKKGHPITPVTIEGRAIATTFWGKAWCANLESYHDFENRLPRGRTYVRNGSVVDLQIAPLAVNALVSGSSIYKVVVSVAAVPKAHWRSICKDCAGGIDSLVELLRGRFSTGVMERICRQDKGLFPRPSEIRFSCSCPDFASMCKHVAAVLYGVGARLDQRPELLFQLRAVDENDLLANLDATIPLSATAPAAGKVLEVDDISALFGLEMLGSENPAEADGGAPVAPVALKPAIRKRGGARSRSVAPNTSEPRQATKVPGRNPAQPAVVPELVKVATPPEPPVPETATQAKHRRKSKKSAVPVPIIAKPGPKTASVRPANAKAAPVELTPDGFVKWWK